MKNKFLLLLVSPLLLIFIASCSPKPSLEVLGQAQPWTATTVAGEEIRFPQQLTGPTIVLFWATWCPYCKALMPHLQSVVDEYRDRLPGLTIYALSIRDDGDPMTYLKEQGYEFELIVEADDIAKEWGVKATPGLFLVNSQGQLLFDLTQIPRDAYPSIRDHGEKLSNRQKAARMAPFWAARLRVILEQVYSK